MTKVICSHGFGVDKTDRGLFIDIAADFPDDKFEMFDYNIMESNGDMTVRTLEEQAEILNKHLANAKDVTLLCHSQGCVIASLSSLENVTKVIFLAPPDNLDLERFVEVFSVRPETKFDPTGTSVFVRSDGTKTYIGSDFIQSVQDQHVAENYQKLASQVPLTILRSLNDEVVGETSFKWLDKSHIIDMDANHNFNGESRQKLIEKLHELI